MPSSSRHRLRVRFASVAANSERPLYSADLEGGLSGATAKEQNR